VKISVVIPTTLRPTLRAAVLSVRQQTTTAEIEIVLVVDAADSSMLSDDVKALVDVVSVTGGVGGAAARNRGIEQSTGDLIAFLDDDDEWLPEKLQHQIDFIADTPSDVVLCGRVRQGQRGTDNLSDPFPTKLWSLNDGTVDEYLFVRRRPSLDRASIFTSAVLVSAPLARRIPWKVGLRRHQDWDWIMRLTREPGVFFAITPEPDVIIWANSTGSIAASHDWSASLDWIESWRDVVDPKVVADFIAGQPLRYAFQARSLRGVRLCAKAIYAAGRVPSLGPVAIGLSGLVSRDLLFRVLTPKSRKRREVLG